MMQLIGPTEVNQKRMWERMEELFPIYREVVGPGFNESLERLKKCVPLETHDFSTSSKAFDWVIPQEFWVNESYIEHESGKRFLDFKENSLHVYGHSQPFKGEMDLKDLLPHIATHPKLPNAIPMRCSFYQKKWTLCASQEQLKSLPPGKYRVNVDVELREGALRMGEYFLPGESEEEVLISTYLCHPRGANDNLSGVVVATELFHLLAKLPKRRLSYRLLVIPETIGSITYIYHFQERLKKMLGGYSILCVGDRGKFNYKQSKHPESVIDRAAAHALRVLGYDHQILPYYHLGSDERQFNSPALQIPYGCIMRTPPNEYPEYHTSLDDLSVVDSQAMLESLKVYWHAIQAIERAEIYRGNFVVEPFLTGLGIYPHDLGAGDGEAPVGAAEAFYQLMGFADGTKDLIAIADQCKMDVQLFDRAVRDFSRVGLLYKVDPKNLKKSDKRLAFEDARSN